jgi:putative ABC transport system permease protein
MTISTSWRKAFRDLWENKIRAVLVILALVVGVVSVGTVSTAYSILIREMNENYLRTDPASATLWVTPLDTDLVQTVANMPQIGKAEARSQIIGRFQIASGEWRELWLYVIPDFNNIQLDTFTPEQGSWPPATGDILLERTAVSVAQVSINDRVTVKIPNQKEQTLSFTGTVHTPGLPPAWVEGRVYGYITPGTLALFGDNPAMNQLKITVSKNELDKAYITQTTYELKNWLENKGYTVSRIDIPEPGKHIHADLMSAFITMLGVMGILALIMASILVTNMIASMMGQQIRQIGIMKSIGGGVNQISRIYFSVIFYLGMVALIIGLPISLILGRALADYEAVQMLNFEIFDNHVDLWVYLLVVMVGLLIPFLAAANPIIKGSRVTILAALNDYGTGQAKFGASRVDILLRKIKGGGNAFLLSLRNVFRQRIRLILTMLTLAVAGANFITAMNVAASIDQAVSRKYDATPFDIQVAFSKVYPQSEIEQAVNQVDSVARMETWAGAMASVMLPDGMMGKQLNIVAPHINTELSPKPPIIQGRWLSPDDKDAIVMNVALLKKLDLDAKIGNKITLVINDQKATWQLVGISQEYLTSSAYVPFDSFMQSVAGASQSTYIVIKATNRAQTDEVTKNLESQLERAGLDVYTIWKTEDTRKVMEEHMVLITGILLIMAVLFIIVGGLGIATTISLNVLERTRELGIMRAIGATTSNVLQIIILEGALIGVASWVISILLSIPYSGGMGQVFDMFLESPVDITLSGVGLSLWFIIVTVIASVASAIPAWNAARRPVSQVLAYE